VHRATRLRVAAGRSRARVSPMSRVPG
jgi:hypothetical protein